MNGSTTTVLAATVAFVLGAFSAGDVSDHLGIAVALTGLFIGLARYGAVLRGGSKKEIEHATAVGFFIGLAVAAAVIGYLVVVVA